MPLFLAVLDVELRKLKRSPAVLLAAVVPTLIAVFLFFNLLRDKQPRPWDLWLQNAAAVWAFFMLPMGVTALAALVAQLEHGTRSWDHLRALPLPRWYLYAAKTLCVLAVIALMSVAVLVLSAGALQLAAWIKPALAPTGEFHAMHHVVRFAQVYLAALLLVAVQLWLALRYHSFIPTLAVGIGGTFFAVVASSARIGIVLPWQIPLNVLATDPQRATTALLIGSLAGVAALLLMLVHLSHREVP